MQATRTTLKIMLPLAAIVLLTVFFAYLIYQATEKQLVVDFGNDQLVLAASAAKNIDFYLRSLSTDSLRLSRDLSAGGLTPAEAEGRLSFTFGSMYPASDVILYTDREGKILSVFPPNYFPGTEEKIFYESGKVLQGMKEAPPFIYSRSLRVHGQSRCLVILASPVYASRVPEPSPSGRSSPELQGVVGIGINIDQVVERFILPDISGEVPTIFIIDQDGMIIAHSSREIAGHTVASLNGRKTAAPLGIPASDLDRILQGTEISGVIWGGDPGHEIVAFAIDVVGGKRWLIGVSRPFQQVSRALNRIQKYYFSFLAFLLCLGFAAGLFILKAHRARVRMEEEARVQGRLKESEERYRTLVESSPDGIITLDRDGKVETFNQTFAVMLGYPPEEITGLPFSRAAILPGQKPFPPPASLLGRKGTAGVELQLCRRDGAVLQISMDITAKPGGEGSSGHYFAVLRDVTERKELEGKLAFADKMAGIGQLAAGIAHEFNNLLSVIRSSAEIVAHGGRDPLAAHDIGKIVKASERGAALVDGLLHFARRKSGQKEKLDLCSALDEVVELVEADFRTSGLSVKKDYSPVPPVSADKGQLQQVFLNLIINARDAMSSGNALVLRVARIGEEVVMEFINNGRPISTEALPRIFEPFYSSRESVRTGKKGSGLGLSISLGIIESHGGAIDVKSGPETGTVFSVRLPVAEGREGPTMDNQGLKR
ncbi:MAG: PAS domain S-box protein [Candidatus Aureabacteria bacterium]|nr:PAS domain S-box protein [Candidatus Auribacterota bacterium]